MDCLDGLEEVPWASLSHAYGEASDIPDLLRALANPASASDAILASAKANGHATVQEEVEWALWGNLFHQGTRYRATAPAVPFLVNILVEQTEPGSKQAFLVLYLHSLAVGHALLDLPHPFDPDSEFAPARGLSGFDCDDVETRCLCWARDAYEAVERELPRLLPLLRSEDPTIVGQTLALCASMPRQKELFEDELLALARGASVHAPFATLCLALLRAPEAPGLVARLLDADDELGRVMGACASVVIDANAPSQRTVEVLSWPLERMEALDAGDEPVGYVESLREMAQACRVGLAPGPRSHVVTAVCEQFRDASASEQGALLYDAMSLVYEDGRYAGDRDPVLSELRHQVLETIWRYGAYDDDERPLDWGLRDAGLPPTREGLATLLEGRGTASLGAPPPHDLSVVRNRPGMYIGDTTDGSGLHHLLWEVIANSLDQHLVGNVKRICVTLQNDLFVRVEDDGPGIPLSPWQRGRSTLERVLTELHTGPTADGHAPHTHVGLFGVGLAVVNALCAHLGVRSQRHGQGWAMGFERGAVVQELTWVEEPFVGTSVTFLPDAEVFGSAALDLEVVRARLAELQGLSQDSGLVMELVGPDGESVPLLCENGLFGLLPDAQALSKAPRLELRGASEGIWVHVALAWGAGDGPSLHSFVNMQRTPGGGSHEEGLLAALGEMDQAMTDEETGASLSNGLRGAVHVRTDDSPTFGTPTKDRLAEPRIQRAVHKVVASGLGAPGHQEFLRDLVQSRSSENL